jgi:hypothetical protein
MSEIRIFNTGGENLHIEILPNDQGINITKPGHATELNFKSLDDPRVAKLRQIIDRLDEAAAYHQGKHGASPKVDGPSGWIDLIDVLDELAEALNADRG